MPPRHWKWRMRGAALWMAKELTLRFSRPDLLFASDYVNLADLVALLPEDWRNVPRAIYFHENQLTYPVSPGEKLDFHFGLVNVVSAMVAQRLFFNSRYHLDEFFRELPRFLRMLPDYRPLRVIDDLAERAEHLPLGCHLSFFNPFRKPRRERGIPRKVLWNHRWEFDKNPEEFFQALFAIKDQGIPFRLMVLGQSASRWPAIFDEAKHRLRDEVITFGYVEDRAQYAEMISKADIVVSTAIHEFFGVAVVEAIYCGAYPLLPERLAYPELIPVELRDRHLYRDSSGLVRRLRDLLEAPVLETDAGLAAGVAQYDWSKLRARYDKSLSEVRMDF